MCVVSSSSHRFSLFSALRLSLSSPKIGTCFIFCSLPSNNKQIKMEDHRRRDSSSSSVIPDLSVAHGCEYSKIRLHPIGSSEKTVWTNEKHDMYLDHLESSFVKQLHRSVLNNHPRCTGKQRFVRATKMQDSSTAMNLFTREKDNFFNEAGLSTEQTFERHGKSLDYFEEFSDQNFPDEASEQMCVTMMSKRSKTIVS